LELAFSYMVPITRTARSGILMCPTPCKLITASFSIASRVHLVTVSLCPILILPGGGQSNTFVDRLVLGRYCNIVVWSHAPLLHTPVFRDLSVLRSRIPVSAFVAPAVFNMWLFAVVVCSHSSCSSLLFVVRFRMRLLVASLAHIVNCLACTCIFC
jgi:hypothetical protein